MAAIGLIGKGILKLFLLASKSWWIVITLIVLSSTIISSINEGIEQEDWSIPVKDLGLFIVSSDEKVHLEVQELEKENLEIKIRDGFFGVIKEILGISWHIFKNLFVGLWMVFFNFILFYKIFLFSLGEDSKKRRAAIISVITMAILQLIVGGIPFRGVYSLGKLIIGIVGGM